MKLVIHKLICKCQTAFVANRKLLDGVLVLNEVVDFAKRLKRRCMLVKMDFEKVHGLFLRSKLRRMGFGDKWCGWMEVLVFNSSIFVLNNGIPMVDFKFSRGLSKGDAIFPFLFPLVA